MLDETDGEIVLALGAVVPSLGDVTDEEPEDDGALVGAGFASLTPLVGVHEDVDIRADEIVRALAHAARTTSHRLTFAARSIWRRRIELGVCMSWWSCRCRLCVRCSHVVWLCVHWCNLGSFERGSDR